MATYYVTSAAAGGGVGSEGDPFTLAEAADNVAAGDTVYVKADASYGVQDGTSNAVLELTTAGTDVAPIIWIGYTTTIDDGGIATIDASTNTLANCVVSAVAGLYNEFNGFRYTGGTGPAWNGGTSAGFTVHRRCRFDNSVGGFFGDNANSFFLCQFDTLTDSAIDVDNDLLMDTCLVFSTSGNPAVVGQADALITKCVFYAFGANAAFETGSSGAMLTHNVVDGDGVTGAVGFDGTGSGDTARHLIGNIFMDVDVGVGNSDAGIVSSVRGYNFFVNCSSNYEAAADHSTDTSTTTDPFTDSANRDYSLSASSAAKNAAVDITDIPSF